MYACKLQVFFLLLTPIIEITVKNQDVQNAFLVSWYHVSSVWLTAPSTSLIELVLREKKWRHLFDQRTDLGWTTRPSATDRVFIVMLIGDWGEGTRKRSGINGKGSLARSCHHTLRMSSVLPTVPLLFFFFRGDGLVSVIAWKISIRVCWDTGITILGSH